MPFRPIARTALALALAALVLAACSSGGGDGASGSDPSVGTLRVSVDPSAATVTVAQDGTTDVTRRGSGDVELDAGTYTVRATADGYRSASTTARVTAGSVTRVSLDLEEVATEPETGTLQVSVTPASASVAVSRDGEAVASWRGSDVREVAPGTYRVRAEASGYVADARTVTVTAGERASVSIDLVPRSDGLVYGGEWAWLLEFTEFDGGYSGFVSISESIEDDGDLTGVEAGAWRWCDGEFESCGGPVGIGLFATFEGTDLVSSFIDTNGFLKAVSIDLDGRLEDTDEGNPAFGGVGEWSFYSGGTAAYVIALVRVQETPVFSSVGATSAEAPEVGPSVRAELERRLEVLRTSGAWEAGTVDALATAVDRRAASLVGR